MPAILSKRPAAHLTIAGFGPESDELHLRAASLGLHEKVRFLGAVQQVDLPAMYRRAAVLAAPFVAARSGDQEGLGLVLVEAIGCGCPVVTTRLPAIAETFPHWHACLVEPNRSDKLAAQLCHVLACETVVQREIIAMRNELISRFDWNLVAHGYAKLLKASRHIPA
jgi:glycosyltransferase involved in cell wall biosynthesis